MTDKVWVWDTWPLTGLDTKPLKYKGWQVIMSLVAPRDIPFGDRHWQARIGYFYSKDGRNWRYGGHLFPDGYSKGSREWAGTAIIVLTGKNQVTQFYTASGHDGGGINNTDFQQRLARPLVRSTPTRRVCGSPASARPSRPTTCTRSRNDHQFADHLYVPGSFDVRDPQGPEDLRALRGQHPVQEPTSAPRRISATCPRATSFPVMPIYTGNIGLMSGSSKDITKAKWKLLPPVLSANCVNQQTEERRTWSTKNGKYYPVHHQSLNSPTRRSMRTRRCLRVRRSGPAQRLQTAEREPWSRQPAGRLRAEPHARCCRTSWVESFIDTVPTGNGQVRFEPWPRLQLKVDGANTYLTALCRLHPGSGLA